jgi:hypothetical protein
MSRQQLLLVLPQHMFAPRVIFPLVPMGAHGSRWIHSEMHVLLA